MSTLTLGHLALVLGLGTGVPPGEDQVSRGFVAWIHGRTDPVR